MIGVERTAMMVFGVIVAVAGFVVLFRGVGIRGLRF